MQLGEAELVEQVELIWCSILDFDVIPCDPGQVSAEPGSMLTGCIQITGAWEGAITLACDDGLTTLAASRMFDIEPGELTPDLIQDALGELTNMTGGNLKALLPGPSYLCLPTVVDGNEYVHRVLKVKKLFASSFQFGPCGFTVTVFEKDRERFSANNHEAQRLSQSAN